jgi:hypothetical protein
MTEAIAHGNPDCRTDADHLAPDRQVREHKTRSFTTFALSQAASEESSRTLTSTDVLAIDLNSANPVA